MRSAEEILAAATIDSTKPLRETIANLLESAQREAWNEAIEAAAKIVSGNAETFSDPDVAPARYLRSNADAIRSLHREEE